MPTFYDASHTPEAYAALRNGLQYLGGFLRQRELDKQAKLDNAAKFALEQSKFEEEKTTNALQRQLLQNTLADKARADALGSMTPDLLPPVTRPVVKAHGTPAVPEQPAVEPIYRSADDTQSSLPPIPFDVMSKMSPNEVDTALRGRPAIPARPAVPDIMDVEEQPVDTTVPFAKQSPQARALILQAYRAQAPGVKLSDGQIVRHYNTLVEQGLIDAQIREAGLTPTEATGSTTTGEKVKLERPPTALPPGFVRVDGKAVVDPIRAEQTEYQVPLLGGRAASKQQAAELNNLASEMVSATQSIDELIGMIDKGVNRLSPTQEADAATLQTTLIGQLRLALTGPGAMSEGERQMLKEVIAKPTAWFTLDSSNKTKLNKLKSVLDRKVVNAAKAAGIEKPTWPPQKQSALPAVNPTEVSKPGGSATISTKAAYDALPKGAAFTWTYPDGTTKSGVKP